MIHPVIAAYLPIYFTTTDLTGGPSSVDKLSYQSQLTEKTKAMAFSPSTEVQ